MARQRVLVVLSWSGAGIPILPCIRQAGFNDRALGFCLGAALYEPTHPAIGEETKEAQHQAAAAVK